MSNSGNTPQDPYGTPDPYGGQQPDPADEGVTQIRPAGSSSAPQYNNPDYNPSGQNDPYGQQPPGQDHWSQDQYGSQGQSAPDFGKSDQGQQYGDQYGQQYGSQPYGGDQYGQQQYGQQYGQEQYGQQGYQQGYQQQGYGDQYAAAGYGGYAAAGTQGAPLAPWGKRALGFIIDVLPFIVVGIIVNVVQAATLSTDGSSSAAGLLVGLVGFVVNLGWWIYNYGVLGGKTGYTVGRGIMGVQVVKESTGQPLGLGLGLVRYIAHLVDSLICLVGYLWPLWDSKNQTLADKIMGTVALDRPKS